MQIKFWGVRGSAAPSNNAAKIRSKVVRAIQAALDAGLQDTDAVDAFVDNLPFPIRGGYGSNTPCLEVMLEGDTFLLLDAGLGLRDFGVNHFATRSGAAGSIFHILMSHLHWDHIQGMPFFPPLYLPGNRINVYGCHDGLEEAFVQQQEPPFFPVPLFETGAVFQAHKLEPQTQYTIAGHQITAIRQHHPGVSYTYKIQKNGKTLIYATDCEHHLTPAGHDRTFVDFIRGADLVVLDAQYDFATSQTLKKDWGHSSNVVAVEMAKEGGVKQLCLFHHEPAEDDDALELFFQQTVRYSSLHKPELPLEVFMAYDGLEVTI